MCHIFKKDLFFHAFVAVMGEKKITQNVFGFFFSPAVRCYFSICIRFGSFFIEYHCLLIISPSRPLLAVYPTP